MKKKIKEGQIGRGNEGIKTLYRGRKEILNKDRNKKRNCQKKKELKLEYRKGRKKIEYKLKGGRKEVLK